MKLIQGDLLEIKSGVILHQVNTRGVTGGLAGALRRKWPEAFDIYDEVCKDNHPEISAGTCATGTCNGSDLMIAHVFGQVNPGPNTDLKLVDSALIFLASWYWSVLDAYDQTEEEFPVYAPWKIGCGMGGGDWDKYLPLLVKHIPDVIIVQKYAQ